MKKILKIVLTCILSITVLTGCTTTRSRIAYTVYPIGYLLQRLGGTDLPMLSLQDGNSIVQRASIRSDYEEVLSNSLVFFHIGDLEPYLTVYRSDISAQGATDIDLSTLNAVYNFARYTQVITDGEVTYIETPYYRDEAFNLVDKDRLDLYLWNDPITMFSMAKDVHAWLVKTYPEQQAYFDDNLERLETDLINLDAQYQALATSLINNNQEIRFVSMTASFGNWQKTYGFQVYPVVISKYGVLPNKKQLDLIKSRILADGVKYIVYEPNMPEDMVELFNELEEELSLTRVELSNLSSLTDLEISEGKDYLSLMYENLSVLDTMKTDRVTAQSTEETQEENQEQDEEQQDEEQQEEKDNE
ncbi:MAG: zinc ABC transporter substrate-binding protein [Solobacterium sp.]|nr:zinc ABC transporter substrate-binding protein [Solobacterium sp.]